MQLNLRSILGSYCLACRRPGRELCTACRRDLRPPAATPVPGVDATVAACSYQGTLRRLILDLKLRGVAAAARPLGDLCAAAAVANHVTGRCVTWVPCRRTDALTRGFDHAELIARRVSQMLGMRCTKLLERRGPTVDQSGLSAEQRAENMRGAFFVAGRSPERVVLVDDLVTTGATAAAAATALKRAGASRVELVVAGAAERGGPQAAPSGD